MHRTNGKMRSLFWGTLLAVLMSGLASISQAQPAMAPSILVPLGGIRDVQMTTKKAIKKAEVKRDGVVSIRPVAGDPTTIRLIGQAPDSTPLELTDEDGKVETYLVVVQRDVENLKVQLRRAVPMGNVVVTPMNEATVLLTGTISRAADSTVLDQVTRALGFQPLNQVTVGGVQQVQLDVVVALVARSAFRNMAFDFLANSKNFYFASTASGAVSPLTTAGNGAAVSGATGTIGPALGGLAGNVGTPGGVPTDLLFGVVHNGWNFLGFLEALREENLVKTLAQPKLITLSGQPASFLSGGEQAIPVPAGLGQVGVQFEEFGVRLNFLPIVLGNGKIYLEVEPELSSLDAANGVTIQGTVVPGRDTNRVHTSVELDVGHTFVIGGMIEHTVTASDAKVPILGDLPYIGVAFRRMTYQENENEVLILVTPHLVEGFDCSQAPKILPGQETRSPDDYELFLEGILEAPRGQRCVFPDDHYVPAYKSGPSTNVYPCGDKCPGGCGLLGGCGLSGCKSGCNSGCATGGCANGSCSSGGAVKPMPPAMPPAPPVVKDSLQAVPPMPVVPSPTTTPIAPPPTTPATPMLPPSDTSATVPPPVPEALRPVPPPEPATKPMELPPLSNGRGQLP
jgi:pilus assembly protein CpaC